MHSLIILRLMCYHYADNYYQFCTINGHFWEYLFLLRVFSRAFLRSTIISRVPQTLWPRIKTSRDDHLVRSLLLQVTFGVCVCVCVCVCVLSTRWIVGNRTKDKGKETTITILVEAT